MYDTYQDLFRKWNRDRIGEVRAEFHWVEAWCGFALGFAVAVIIFFVL